MIRSAVAQQLGHSWIGIDITHVAVNLIKQRLQDSFGKKVKFNVVGEPASLADAQELADTDPFQFQWWALSLVHARPTVQKKGADKGIDGRMFFLDGITEGEPKQVIFSVKAGATGPNHVRDLRGVVEREGSAIGVLLTMHKPTNAMRTEAASARYYESPGGSKHPRLQILTVAELLEGHSVDLPPWRAVRTFKAAKRVKSRGSQTTELPYESGAEEQ